MPSTPRVTATTSCEVQSAGLSTSSRPDTVPRCSSLLKASLSLGSWTRSSRMKRSSLDVAEQQARHRAALLVLAQSLVVTRHLDSLLAHEALVARCSRTAGPT